jgi:hypothetical protein
MVMIGHGDEPSTEGVGLPDDQSPARRNNKPRG